MDHLCVHQIHLYWISHFHNMHKQEGDPFLYLQWVPSIWTFADTSAFTSSAITGLYLYSGKDTQVIIQGEI